MITNDLCAHGVCERIIATHGGIFILRGVGRRMRSHDKVDLKHMPSAGVSDLCPFQKKVTCVFSIRLPPQRNIQQKYNMMIKLHD